MAKFYICHTEVTMVRLPSDVTDVGDPEPKHQNL